MKYTGEHANDLITHGYEDRVGLCPPDRPPERHHCRQLAAVPSFLGAVAHVTVAVVFSCAIGRSSARLCARVCVHGARVPMPLVVPRARVAGLCTLVPHPAADRVVRKRGDHAVIQGAGVLRVGSYPIVSLQCSLTTAYRVFCHTP